jgi:hypothetical protein
MIVSYEVHRTTAMIRSARREMRCILRSNNGPTHEALFDLHLRSRLVKS